MTNQLEVALVYVMYAITFFIGCIGLYILSKAVKDPIDKFFEIIKILIKEFHPDTKIEYINITGVILSFLGVIIAIFAFVFPNVLTFFIKVINIVFIPIQNQQSSDDSGASIYILLVLLFIYIFGSPILLYKMDRAKQLYERLNKFN